MPITDLQRQLLRLPGGPDAHFARPTANEIPAKLCPRPAECKAELSFTGEIADGVGRIVDGGDFADSVCKIRSAGQVR